MEADTPKKVFKTRAKIQRKNRQRRV